MEHSHERRNKNVDPCSTLRKKKVLGILVNEIKNKTLIFFLKKNRIYWWVQGRIRSLKTH